MKRLSTKIVPFLSLTLLLSAFFVFPVFADTSGSATATVQFNAIIDTFVEGAPFIEVYQDTELEPGKASIDQVDGTGSWAQFEASDGSSSPDISVTVRALTNFEVGAGYYSGGTEDANGLLKLVGDSDFLLPWLSGSFDAPNADAPEENLGDLVNISSGFSGEPNLGSGGDTMDYNLEIDMGKLTGDYVDDDSLDLTVAFFVYDATTV